MFEVIGRLPQILVKALITLAQFITILALGLMIAIVTALPWLIRITSVLSWLIGGYFAIQAIQEIYGPSSPAVPVFALQFAVIFMMVAWVGGLLLKSLTHLWGGLLLGGLFSIWLRRLVIPTMLAGWANADFLFRILPPTLLAMTMFYQALRLRRMRSTGNLILVNPAFLWLPKAVHQAKETIQQRGHHE